MRIRPVLATAPLFAVALTVVLVACGSSDPVSTGDEPARTTMTSTTREAPGRGPAGCEPGTGPAKTTIPQLPDPGGIEYGCDPTTTIGGRTTIDPDTPVSTVVDPNEPGTDPTDPTPTKVPNRRSITNASHQASDEVVVDPEDDRILHVRYWGGVPDCYGAMASGEGHEDRVEVVLLTGSLPNVDDPCPEMAQYLEVDIELREPLGGRRIVIR